MGAAFVVSGTMGSNRIDFSMHKTAAIILSFIIGCAAGPQASGERTTPDAINPLEMPVEPDEVPQGQRVVEPVESCLVDGGDREIGPGIFMSDPMARRAAELSIAYDELRSLYGIDLRTREREREITTRLLEEADGEIADLRKRVERTYWEREGDTVMLIVGIILGAGAAAAAAAVAATVD